ncbi:MAG: LamG domain-containing protein [Verrucomicrobia bacterium]|nr:LamG domain-containing protein [Verrucomicrobiota bacterium]
MKSGRSAPLARMGALFLLVAAPQAQATEDAVAWWKFDGPAAVDAAGGVTDAIQGNSKFMPEGVRGGCLRFDGFTTLVRRAAAKVPDLARGFTVQGWVALAAYPWNWTPVLAQRDAETRGFSFGIDSTGHFGLQLATDFRWTTCVSTQVLGFRTWYHLAVTYDPAFGVRLFLDGQEAGAFPLEKRLSLAKEIDLFIGRNHEQMVPAHLVRDWAKFPSWWALDGLLDELTIHDRVLSAAAIQASRAAAVPSGVPNIPPRRFPEVAKGVQRFGAYPSRLEYYEQWDALWQSAGEPDIVVKFDELPVQLVFWRGTRYSPCWVSENGKWMADQSLEAGVWPEELRRRGGQGAVGCCEHMSDAQCRFSHVRIVENTDARVVVHWRYAMVDAAYRFAEYDEVAGQGQYGDEFYYIYPDGVASRDVTGWWPERTHRVDQETIFLSEPGTRPEDNCELAALSLANLKGEATTYSWENGYPTLDLAQPVIQMVNLKSRFKPLIIVKPGSTIGTFNCEVRKEFSHFPWWNHWPVARVSSDGRYAMAADQAAHSSLSWVTQAAGAFLYGMTDQAPLQVLPMAKAWIHPPALKLAGAAFSSDGYDPDQRAYLLHRVQPDGVLEAELAGCADSPVVNPALVIRGWGEDDAVLKLDGDEVPRGRNFRYGHRRTLDGTDLIVWIKTTSEQAVPLALSVGKRDVQKNSSGS